MVIYKDLFTRDDLFSDEYPIKERYGIFYEVTGKLVVEKVGIDAKEQPQGHHGVFKDVAMVEERDGLFYDVGGKLYVEKGGRKEQRACSIVQAYRLVELGLGIKRNFRNDVEAYVKRLQEHLEENKPERAESFKAAVGPAMQKIWKKMHEWQFFMGSSQDEEGMIALMAWKDDTTPYMLFFKDGLIEY